MKIIVDFLSEIFRLEESGMLFLNVYLEFYKSRNIFKIDG